MYKIGFLTFTTGLDPSWVATFNTNNIGGSEFSLIFGYGPLAYLWIPMVYNYNFFWEAIIFNIGISAGLLVALLFLSMKYCGNSFIVNLLPLVALIPLYNLPITYRIEILAIILLFLSLSYKEYKIAGSLTFLSFVLLAVGSLIKFDVFLIAVITGILFIILEYALHRRFVTGLIGFGAFVLSIVFLWHFLGYDLNSLINFIPDNIEFARGYNLSMGIDFFSVQIIRDAIILSLLLVFAISYFMIFDDNHQPLIFFILASFLYFAAFKHGSVRADNHIQNFYNVVWVFLVLVLILSYKEEKQFEVKS
jgi:hypothetical protein